MKRVVPRPQAELDFDSALAYYAQESSAVAEDFLREVQRAYDRIGELPGIGSPHFRPMLSDEDLRAYSLRIFPYIVFYIERDTHVDVLRLLHSHRDVLHLPIVDD